MPGQTPSRGDALPATVEVVAGLSNTHRRHAEVHLGGGGQFDQKDVVVDGVAVVTGVLEDLMLKGDKKKVISGLMQIHKDSYTVRKPHHLDMT